MFHVRTALAGSILRKSASAAPRDGVIDASPMCGNVTILGRLSAGESRALPKRATRLLKSMLAVSQIRGSQSGGGAIQVQRGGAPRQVIRKCLNSKRGELATRMVTRMARSSGFSPAWDGGFLVQSHVRFATSGVSTQHEAHPFRFVDASNRGPRRVMSYREGKLSVSVRSVETALTHNGDFDGLKWRGQLLRFPDLGYFLEHLLGVKNRWIGDSPQLSAAIELFLTRGMWCESLRLAYHLTLAPRAPDLSTLRRDLVGDERRKAAAELLRDYPVPGVEELSTWEALAEALAFEHPEAWETSEAARAIHAKDEMVERLCELRQRGHFASVPESRMRGFARAAVDAFFDNDLYVALRKLEPALLGTFGCVVTSTLEPNSCSVLSRGQPLSIGFQRSTGTVAVVSERTALKVTTEDGELAFEERLDLDLCRGEIARVVVGAGSPIHLTLYAISEGRERTPGELQRAGRVVALRDNPFVSALPQPAVDRIEDDRRVLGSLLTTLRASWRDGESHNRQTAQAFAEALFQRRRPRLLVIGVTNDLWLSEQFAHNFERLFPAIPARAVSSNQVLCEPSVLEIDSDTVVLAVSQSGQDFPTLGALLVLGQRLGARSEKSLFVMTGEADCLMGQAVGQQYAKGASFSRRIFINHSGFRPTEAAIATVSATHHCLVELLLFLARHTLDQAGGGLPAYGLTLTPEQLLALDKRGSLSVKEHAAAIAGGEDGGVVSQLSAQLQRGAERWKWHVVEGVVGFLALVGVLELNLQLHLGIVPSTLVDWATASFSSAPEWLNFAGLVMGGQLDVLFYAFLVPLTVWLMRSVQRRTRFHRHGLRELLIGDTGYVHRIAWLFARKLFSLSYGFASVKPYSADCQDELVMTHEPVRGSLLLIGVPDFQKNALRTRADAALMTVKQFDSSRSLAGAGAEIVTISHAPATAGAAIAAHITLPNAPLDSSSPLLETLCEGLFDSWERLLAMQVFLDRFAKAVATLGPLRYDRSRTKDQVFAPTTASPVSAAAIYELLSRAEERYEQFQHLSLPFDVQRSSWRSSAPGVRTSVWGNNSAAGPSEEPRQDE